MHEISFWEERRSGREMRGLCKVLFLDPQAEGWRYMKGVERMVMQVDFSAVWYDEIQQLKKRVMRGDWI